MLRRTSLTIAGLLCGLLGGPLVGLKADEPAGPLPMHPLLCRGGIYPTVLTPWRCDGGVDELALAAQIDLQLRHGVHGLLVLGTLGEGEYATCDERAQVIRVAVARTRGCVPVIVGIHTCDCAVACEQIRQAAALGAHAVLVKYAGRPRACFGEVHGFFSHLAAINCLPIFYYHYPSQTGLKLTAAEVAQILLLPNVIGIKESTLDLRETEQHVALTRGAGRVFLSGTALNLTQFLAVGGHGAMCPEAVLLPGCTVACFQAAVAGEGATARRLQKNLFCVAPILRGGLASQRTTQWAVMSAQDLKLPLPMTHGHPQARLKWALNHLSLPISPAVKPPLPPLTPRDHGRVDRLMAPVLGFTWSCSTATEPALP